MTPHTHQPRRLLLLVPLLLMALLFASAATRPGPPAQEQGTDGDEPTPQEAHVINSVAACGQVDYGTPLTGATTGMYLNGDVFFATPPNPNGPVIVDLGLYIVEVTGIDEVTSTFTIEGFMDMIWCDARETFDPDELGWHAKIFLEEDAQAKISEMWWPDLTFPNESGARAIEAEELIIWPDGTVEYEERFSAQLETHYEFRQFPFDTQHLHIEIESFAWDEAYLIFHEEQDRIGFSDEFEIPEWHTVDVSTHIEEVQEIRDPVAFSEFVMDITVKRQSGYFIGKLIVPLVLLVILSWAVFWMVGEGLTNRLYISLTGVLTVVAYQFATTGNLPRIATVTMMDAILLVSFASLVLAAIENVVAGNLRIAGHDDLATKLDYTSRWVFPLAYVVAWAIIWLTYAP